jgi:general secretion pathway protein L
LPSRATAILEPNWQKLPCRFALVNNRGEIEREAVLPVAELSAVIAHARSVVAMLAASDVTLLRVAVPPLSAAKLKVALPNLIEDQLLGNFAETLVMAGGAVGGLHTIAAVQRDWLEQIAKVLMGAGARKIRVFPVQLCLLPGTGRVVAALTEQGDDVGLILRLSEQEGMGLALASRSPPSVIETLCSMVRDKPITLHVPREQLEAYQNALGDAGLADRIDLGTQNWAIWINGVGDSTFNLMEGLDPEPGWGVNWRAWRWPLTLAVAVLFANICALNFDWWQMSREAKNLRATMTQIYQSRYPKETVVIDPLAQMQQKIAFAKRDAGLAAPDDFISLATLFGGAWSNATSANKPTIDSLDYHEHTLFVNFKAGANNDSEVLMPQIQTALAAHNVLLTASPTQAGGTAWQIRSKP